MANLLLKLNEYIVDKGGLFATGDSPPCQCGCRMKKADLSILYPDKIAEIELFSLKLEEAQKESEIVCSECQKPIEKEKEFKTKKGQCSIHIECFKKYLYEAEK